MKISDYSLTKCRQKQQLWKRRFFLSLLLDAPIEYAQIAAYKSMVMEIEVHKILRRSAQIKQVSFNLNIYSDKDCLIYFRFTKQHLGRIAKLLPWSSTTERSRYHCDILTAFCIVCRRLGAPTRWTELELIFGMHASKLSEIFWETCEIFLETFGYVLHIRYSVMQEKALTYASVIKEMGAPFDHCVGFIDCTKIRIQRPGGDPALQRACYSGHRRMPCLVFISISTPDGLVFALDGPQVGRRHDLTLFRESGWEDVLGPALTVNNVQFFVYGDAAVLLRPWMQCPFQSEGATALERIINRDMSSIRVTVEHNYKDLKQYWTHNDFARNLKGGQTIQSFGVSPPSLDDYLMFT